MSQYHYLAIWHLLRIFSINQRSLSVGITEGSASVERTTEGSAEGLAEGTFGRSLSDILFLRIIGAISGVLKNVPVPLGHCRPVLVPKTRGHLRGGRHVWPSHRHHQGRVQDQGRPRQRPQPQLQRGRLPIQKGDATHLQTIPNFLKPKMKHNSRMGIERCGLSSLKTRRETLRIFAMYPLL